MIAAKAQKPELYTIDFAALAAARDAASQGSQYPPYPSKDNAVPVNIERNLLDVEVYAKNIDTVEESNESDGSEDYEPEV